MKIAVPLPVPWLLALQCLAAATVVPAHDNVLPVSDWKDITPSPDLKWTPCFDTYSCARLLVPLDYSNPSIGTTSIAYIKLSAKNESSSSQNIQINPGGPGNSGVQTLLSTGSSLQAVFGTQHNVIGFDARGVNNSGPDIDCFPGNPSAKAAFEGSFVRAFDSESPTSVASFYENAVAYGQFCTDAQRNGTGRYAGTVAVAADMVNFAERQAEANGQAAKDAKVWYYGVSYGTVLGTTLTSIYPNRIGRAVLDSFVDGDDWFRGDWLTIGVDAGKAIDRFCTLCYQAGKENCAIWAESPSAIETRIQKVIDNVREDPIPVVDKRVGYPQIVKIEQLNFFLVPLLASQLTFPDLATGLRLLESRNGTAIANDAHTSDTLYSQVLIACLDAATRLDLSTLEKWKNYVKRANKVSQWVPGIWQGVPGMCSKTRNIVPPPSQLFNGTIGANHTSSPMLFLGNLIDPSTSIVNTRKYTARFPGTVLLEQNGTAHGVLGLASACTSAWVNAYFGNGTLPPTNTLCQIDQPDPFAS
ncbi:hypothetical protein K491DRAFT_784747 [Lophiostoma macrostomum CBS 122681]|uniref:Alpha/beta-hydrolase n=1 Tax=Lophiostoma macrostomum CBS 122681 TaxID=1314788 RepID=A0A6A6SI15_9PLEO|nr:hypothetical protein K491DRAFT_784747 [Lophiostoma macrostomum CBS 122681]